MQPDLSPPPHPEDLGSVGKAASLRAGWALDFTELWSLAFKPQPWEFQKLQPQEKDSWGGPPQCDIAPSVFASRLQVDPLPLF